MTTTEPRSVWTVPRNDVTAAMVFARSRGHRLTGDERRVLLRLQDDPVALAAELEAL